jgi:hypothetical protein
MPFDIYRLPPRFRFKPTVFKQDIKLAKNHLAGRHLEDQRIQPIDQQNFLVGSFTRNANHLV